MIEGVKGESPPYRSIVCFLCFAYLIWIYIFKLETAKSEVECFNIIFSARCRCHVQDVKSSASFCHISISFVLQGIKLSNQQKNNTWGVGGNLSLFLPYFLSFPTKTFSCSKLKPDSKIKVVWQERIFRDSFETTMLLSYFPWERLRIMSR